MAEPHLGQLQPFTTIGGREEENVIRSLRAPLSGYIGGEWRGGYWIERLIDEWGSAFGVQYVVPCNSATSGLLAACMAVGIKPGDVVWTTPYSMSATAACAVVLGATVRFVDIDRTHFGIDPDAGFKGEIPKAMIVTNLFGHPAQLLKLRAWCDHHKVFLIEDNAQAPFAMIEGHYTGKVGHIGVFSLNVHKHIQCGEGGVIVTSDTHLAMRLRGAINHGELDTVWPWTGLNLRMTEPIAAIACAQIVKGKQVVQGRREIGLILSDMVKDVPWIKAHVDQPGCRHVYYLWTALLDSRTRRGEFVLKLIDRGVPIRGGYTPTLHRLFNSKDKCPVAEDVDRHIVVFEVCAYDLREEQLKTLREVIKRVTGDMHEDRAA